MEMIFMIVTPLSMRYSMHIYWWLQTIVSDFFGWDEWQTTAKEKGIKWEISAEVLLRLMGNN
jgi:hypothetical protein